jgi:hypothetical protein
MDYCTLWFEGWWSHCCAAHDLAYDTEVVRAVADADLASCVINASSNPVLAVVGLGVGGLMFLGVRLFGWRFYPTK